MTTKRKKRNARTKKAASAPTKGRKPRSRPRQPLNVKETLGDGLYAILDVLWEEIKAEERLEREVLERLRRLPEPRSREEYVAVCAAVRGAWYQRARLRVLRSYMKHLGDATIYLYEADAPKPVLPPGSWIRSRSYSGPSGARTPNGP